LVAWLNCGAQQDFNAARDLLEDVLGTSGSAGRIHSSHADAFNVLAQIERDAGNKRAAAEAATKAYRLAWCDGPPFAIIGDWRRRSSTSKNWRA